MTQQEILKHYFGYDSFREGQGRLIEAILEGRDVLGIMPTGAGKSLCYQIPALMMDGITLVISPLISLMKDQVSNLNQAGILAAYLNSSLTYGQYRKALEFARAGRYPIIYVAPERLMTEEFLQFALDPQVKIAMVAVDEAHCISQWGQDFRPSYLKIAEFIQVLPKRPVIAAYTATATRAVKEDILCILGLQNPFVAVTGYDRKNLCFAVEKPKDKIQALLDYLDKNREKSGIIYCNTRKNVEEIHRRLIQEGYPAVRYHAGLSDEEKKQNQEDFIYDRMPVMVATNAFGMGIDKSNVRFVLHFNMPKDIESYYQEAGRAGRDGEPGECVLYYAGQDVKTNEFLINQQMENEEFDREDMELIRERNFERLRKMTFYCFTNECLREYILRYFGEYGGNYCGNCKNCLTEFQDTDVTKEAESILKLVKTSGQRYGIQAVTDAVHGSDSAKVRQFHLNENTYYGVLKDRTIVRIRQILNDLLVKDYLVLTAGDYPVLRLGERGKAMLDGAEEQVLLKLPKEQPKMQSSAKSGKQKVTDEVKYPLLFERLRQKRYKMAQEAKVPPYIIFSDKTLRQMSTYLPVTKEEMLSINGVGNSKYEKYGEAFAEEIRNFIKENGIEK